MATIKTIQDLELRIQEINRRMMLRHKNITLISTSWGRAKMSSIMQSYETQLEKSHLQLKQLLHEPIRA